LRRFISNFVELVKFITSMLRKGNEVKWTLEARNYFDQIKQALTEAPVLISPDYSKEFLIFSFASMTHWLLSFFRKTQMGWSNLFLFSAGH
jgi:hypothetical protein